MRLRILALIAVALGCSSNEFDITATDAAATDSAVASDTFAGTDSSTPPPPDTAPPPEDTISPPKDTGVVSLDASTGCARTGDCPSNHYCAFAGCATVGICKPLSPMPGPYFGPVCGCDGVTYWNKQHAWINSAPIAHDDPCLPGERASCMGVGTICGGFSDSNCVMQFSAFGTCGVNPAYGGCWRLPPSPSCATGGGPPMLPCVGSTCTTQCSAILAKKTFYPASCVPG